MSEGNQIYDGPSFGDEPQATWEDQIELCECGEPREEGIPCKCELKTLLTPTCASAK